MDKKAIVEQVINIYYGPSACDNMSDTHKEAVYRNIENILTAANYFDILETARDVIWWARYTDSDGDWFCRECGCMLDKWPHYPSCSIGRLVGAMKKAGVEIV